MEHTRTLTSLSDDTLLSRLRELLGESRRLEAEVVAHIGEVDVRRPYAREAAPSMFAYCTSVPHLSEAEAYLRITQVAIRSRGRPASGPRAGRRPRFADEQGRRCPARDRLEFHHRHPFGHGGEHDPDNLALMCSTHNRYLAEVDYGKERVRGRKRERDRVSERREASWS